MIKVLLFIIILSYFVAGVPPRPNPSQLFEARAELHVTFRGNRTLKGMMHLALDQPKGHGLEEWNFPQNPQHNRFLLQRYDINQTFVAEGANMKDCHSSKVKGKMPDFWGWVKEAIFSGKMKIHNVETDVWTFERGHASLSLAVSTQNPNVPIFMSRKSNERNVGVYFNTFQIKTPNPSDFVVPQPCSKMEQISKRQCVDRTTMIANAQVWVDDQVPYNQGATFQGYREDCSGYVSMAWEGPQPGWDTNTLPSVSNQIEQDSLQNGDVLLNVGEHVVIFGGWANSDNSKYYAFEETRPGEGTVTRVTPYPYWYDTASFLPYAYQGAC